MGNKSSKAPPAHLKLAPTEAQPLDIAEGQAAQESAPSSPPARIVRLCLALCQIALEKPVNQRKAAIMQLLGEVQAVKEDRLDRFLVVRCEDPLTAKQLTIVVFYQTKSKQELMNALSQPPKVQQSSASPFAASGFLAQSTPLPPGFALSEVEQGRNVILTGYSLGGAQASYLTHLALQQFSPPDLAPFLSCLSFAAPLLPAPADVSPKHFALYEQIFSHHVSAADFVPRLLCAHDHLARNTGGAVPQGGYFLLSLSSSTSPSSSTCERMDFEQKRKFFGEKWEDLGKKEEAAHSLSSYASLLLSALQGEEEAPATLSPPYSSSTSSLLEWEFNPFVELVIWSGRELELKGRGLSIVTAALVFNYSTNAYAQGEALEITHVSSKYLLCRLPEQSPLDYTRKINLRLDTMFADALVFQDLLVQITGPIGLELFPNELFQTIVPLTHLLVDGGNLEGGAPNPSPPSDSSSLSSLLSKLKSEAQGVVSSLPIEFMFNLISKSEVDDVELNLFIDRLCEVEINHYDKLCSLYMLSVLGRCVNNVRRLSRKTSEIKERLSEALKGFKLSRLEEPVFGRTFLCTINGYESFFIANEGRSETQYWGFIMQCNIKSNVVFVDKEGGYTSLVPKEDKKELDFIVIEVVSRAEQFFENSSVLIKKYHLVYYMKSSSMKEARKTHLYVFEVYRKAEAEAGVGAETGTRSMLMWIEKEEVMDGLAKLITKMKDISGIEQEVHLVQTINTNSYTAPALFVLSWYLMYERLLNVDKLQLLVNILQPQLPLKPIPAKHLESFSFSMHKHLRGQMNTFRSMVFNFEGFQPMGGPSDKINHIYLSMVSQYYSANPPYFCGKAINHLVVNRATGQTEPLFNFIPEPINFTADLEKEAVVQRAKKTIDGVNLLLHVMDKFIALSSQELFQIQTTLTEKIINAAKIPFAVLPMAAWGLYRVGKYLANRQFSNIVAVAERFNRLYNSVFYSTLTAEKFQDLLDILLRLLNLSPEGNPPTLLQKCDCILRTIPEVVGRYELPELIERSEEFFADTRWAPLLDTRSKAFHLFIMKQLYHSQKLRTIRSKFITVGVNGEQNAGKTTLVVELVGHENAPHARPGANNNNATIYPMGYTLPPYSDVMLIDLPGCSDLDTQAFPLIFAKSLNVSVFVISSTHSKNCNTDLSQFVNAILKDSQGPCLICINGFDKHLDQCFDLPPHRNLLQCHPNEVKAKYNALDILKETLLKEAESWRKSSTLGLPSHYDSDSSALPWLDPVLPLEASEDLKHCVVYTKASAKGGRPPLTVWLTSFMMNYYVSDVAKGHLFNGEHVRQWIETMVQWSRSLQELTTLHGG